jgi:flagellar biosynthetic protein FliR
VTLTGAPQAAPPSDFLGGVGFLAVELGVGLLLGFVSRTVFFAVEMAGGVITTEMGLTLPSSFDPLSSSNASAPAIVLEHMAAVLWLCLDLHHWLLLAFTRSYELLPAGGARLTEALLHDVTGRCAGMFGLALQMAAPVFAVSFLISLLFTVLARAVPQMNTFAESFAIRILGGLVVIGLTCHLMAQHIVNYLQRLPDDVLRVAQHLSGA